MLVPVLLAGGSGTRLWPLSREQYPKQFLSLVNDESLLVNTAKRMQALPSVAPPIIICGEDHRFIVAEHMRRAGIQGSHILLEPVGRNTAPAAAIAALHVAQQYGPEAIMMLAPADHAIGNQAAFSNAVASACKAAATGSLTVFGIVPTHPETGYGYVKAGAQGEDNIYDLDAFVEKPDLETAQSYVASGDYYWNGGMFVFQAQTYLNELERLAPEILAACQQAIASESQDLDFTRLDKAAFEACPDDSIDYAVMEKTDKAAMVPLDADWNDVGSWTYMSAVNEVDANGNVLDGDVMVEDSSNVLARSDHRLVGAVGVDNLVIVETKDAVLVSAPDRVQDVKKLVNRLKAQGRPEGFGHPWVYRPWGSYESITEGDRFQVKRIIVKPGEKLSLQMHHHRAEHWIVVAGTARVTVDDKEFLLTEDQSTYIPLGKTHRLENPGTIPLELIEVQSGSYLGEDDIVRFEDVYGRDES